ncbi:hypothetical protein DFS34DRAFT_374670 [Phlyctochytrium arcticum]|nr:hypothetical protein DFS34DRAFT_374670 [Phlyctochytrium arcticum]
MLHSGGFGVPSDMVSHQITLPYSLAQLPVTVPSSLIYDFALERRVLEESERILKEREMAAAALKAKLQQREDERRAEERRKTPGMGSDGEILQPTSSSSSPAPARAEPFHTSNTTSSPHPFDTNALDRNRYGLERSSSPLGAADAAWRGRGSAADEQPRRKPGMDFLEFEQGLPPPDPWHTQDDDDDLRMLKEVMGVPDHRPRPITQSSVSEPPPLQQQNHTTMFPPRSSKINPLPPLSSTHASDDAVLRARTMMANLNVSGPNYDHVPSPPPKPAGLKASGSNPSLQYPILPGINPGDSSRSGHSATPDQAIPARFKEIHSKLSQMGFGREAVDRAIKVHGHDEKKALDFVIAFEEHRSAGFNPEDIEVALSLFNYDTVKERKFLEAYSALGEFGFPKDSMREALLLKNNDRDQALEYLMQHQK